MKKFVSALLTVVATMSISVAAFAVGSVTDTGVQLESNKVTSSNGTSITVKSENTVSTEVKEKLEKNVSAVLGSGKELVSANYQDITISEGSLKDGETVTLTFKVGSVAADSTVDVLHFNGTAWEKVTGKYDPNAGTVTGIFKSFSPVAIVVSKTANVGNNAGNSGSQNNSGSTAPAAVKSPQTADANMVAVAFGALMTAGLGAGFVSRKKK